MTVASRMQLPDPSCYARDPWAPSTTQLQPPPRNLIEAHTILYINIIFITFIIFH